MTLKKVIIKHPVLKPSKALEVINNKKTISNYPIFVKLHLFPHFEIFDSKQANQGYIFLKPLL